MFSLREKPRDLWKLTRNNRSKNFPHMEFQLPGNIHNSRRPKHFVIVGFYRHTFCFVSTTVGTMTTKNVKPKLKIVRKLTAWPCPFKKTRIGFCTDWLFSATVNLRQNLNSYLVLLLMPKLFPKQWRSVLISQNCSFQYCTITSISSHHHPHAVFNKRFRFRLPTGTRKNSILKQIHFGRGFWKVPFSMIFFIG